MPHWLKPEMLSIAVNAATLFMIAIERPFNVARVVYWAGAVMISCGLLLMRGNQ